MTFARFLGCVLGLSITAALGDAADSDKAVQISTLSALPDHVSGGDVLVEIAVHTGTETQPIAVYLNGSDISSTFQQRPDTKYMGLVSGLRIGTNRLEVKMRGRRRASLKIENYPVQGPIVSGHHIEPFICRTEDFVLTDGSPFGPPLDSDCSASPRVVYLYMSTETGSLKVLQDRRELPKDVAKITTTNGVMVNFIVRVETATVNRGIYESVVLHDPISDPAPTPLEPPKSWNKVLLGIHGVGCTGGWYTQGGVALKFRREWLLDVKRLAQGYALFTNTLQNPSDSCNTFLAGETAMMGKERFIESYGVPDYSLTTGVSGGAYTSLAIIDSFPGVFDGAIIGLVFPDALSIALSGMDAHLLRHYFTVTSPSVFTDAQQVAVSGYSGQQAWFDAANQAGRTDAVPNRADAPGYASAVWNSAVPEPLRYDAKNNPRGARPTIWDVARNIYGVDPHTKIALRVFDNVGVQYGLAALNDGIISKTQFLDLNENIGGFDRDDNYMRSRTSGDKRAIVEAYNSGLQLSGAGGLAEVPILDLSAKIDESANYHYQWFHFALRERLIEANGDSSNFVIWRGDPTATDAIQDAAFELMNRWISAIKSDASSTSLRSKVIANKPPQLVDRCWSASGEPVTEPQVFGRKPDAQCNRLWPSYAFPRLIAGGPLAAHILKCELKAIDLRDYSVEFTAGEERRLRHIFSSGVCDWSRKGAWFRHVFVGRSYGPAPSRPRPVGPKPQQGS